MVVLTQNRFAEDRYYGRCVVDTSTDDLGTKRRRLHPEEARLYLISNDSAGSLEARLPLDVRNLRPGFQFCVSHNSSSPGGDVLVTSADGVTTWVTIASTVTHVLCFLTDVSTADGTWEFQTLTTVKQAVRT